MKVTWQELLKHHNGYIVTGEAVVRINKKHISLGKLRNGVFAWTPAGLEMAESYEAELPSALPVRRARKTRVRQESDDADTGDTEL